MLEHEDEKEKNKENHRILNKKSFVFLKGRIGWQVKQIFNYSYISEDLILYLSKENHNRRPPGSKKKGALIIWAFFCFRVKQSMMIFFMWPSPLMWLRREEVHECTDKKTNHLSGLVINLLNGKYIFYNYISFFIPKLSLGVKAWRSSSLLEAQHMTKKHISNQPGSHAVWLASNFRQNMQTSCRTECANQTQNNPSLTDRRPRGPE